MKEFKEIEPSPFKRTLIIKEAYDRILDYSMGLDQAMLDLSSDDLSVRAFDNAMLDPGQPLDTQMQLKLAEALVSDNRIKKVIMERIQK